MPHVIQRQSEHTAHSIPPFVLDTRARWNAKATGGTRGRGWALKRIAMGLVVTALLAGSARAETLLATSVFSGSDVGGDVVECDVTNVGKKEINVAMAIMNASGTLAGGSQVIVPPNQSNSVFLDADGGLVYCRFSGKFAKKDVRASGQRIVGGSTLVLIPAN